MPSVIDLWQKFSLLPGGKRLFSKIVCLKAPYFSSIDPLICELDTAHCEVRLRKRRSVTNHIGTVHAIAMCNMAELSGGLLTDVVVPGKTHRWIPKGMQVEYLKKAGTDLRAVATLEQKAPAKYTTAAELPVRVEVYDTDNVLVFRARIAMWVSPVR